MLGVAIAFAGEAPHELVGLNQEQVVRKLGEPRSQLQAGNRLVMLYPRERITLRDGVVVEVDVLAAEPARRPAVPAPAPMPAPPPVQAPVATPMPAPAAVPQSVPIAPSTAAPAAPAVAAPAVPAPSTSAVGAQPPFPGAAPGLAQPAAGAPPAAAVAAPPARTDLPPPPAPEPESRLGIKLVRPPSAPGVTAPPPAAAPAAAGSVPRSPPATAPVEPRPAAVPAPVVPRPATVATPPPAPPVETRPTEVGPPPPAPSSFTALPTESPRDIVERANRSAETTPKVEPPPPVEKRKDSLSSKLLRERLDRAQAAATTESGFPWIAVGIAAVVLTGGIAFLVIRRRSAASEQATAPVAREAAPSGLGGIGAQRERTSFTADVLSKLEWKRFQELVEAYYSKTGVVALRTRAGPQSPVHIKISWKGESRPFACVRCISQQRGPIGPAPLEELLAVLDAENIRRGYVVTPGTFNSAARELAERKQLTLMTGETLLEKLNALPESARVEIMQLATTGDSTVPSCPVCESKMSLSRENPPVWRCASHPDKSFPAEN